MASFLLGGGVSIADCLPVNSSENELFLYISNVWTVHLNVTDDEQHRTFVCFCHCHVSVWECHREVGSDRDSYGLCDSGERGEKMCSFRSVIDA